MELQDAAAELRSFIGERFTIPDSDQEFTDDVHLFDYGYIDSFGAVDLISYVKAQYSVEITDSDLIAYPLNTIREIATFVVKRLAGNI